MSVKLQLALDLVELEDALALLERVHSFADIFPESSLARLADCGVVIPAPTPKGQWENPETSVRPMGSLFEQSLLVTLDVMAMMLMEKLGQTSEQMFRLHANLE